MNDYDWYLIINRAEFLATGLISRELEMTLEGVGNTTFLVTAGNVLSITEGEVMLSVGAAGDNPFYFQDRAIFLDENENVYWGVIKE